MKKLIFFSLILAYQFNLAQEFYYGGMEFNSRDYPHDKRSSINLTANQKISLQNKFSIWFDRFAVSYFRFVEIRYRRYYSC